MCVKVFVPSIILSGYSVYEFIFSQNSYNGSHNGQIITKYIYYVPQFAFRRTSESNHNYKFLYSLYFS